MERGLGATDLVDQCDLVSFAFHHLWRHRQLSLAKFRSRLDTSQPAPTLLDWVAFSSPLLPSWPTFAFDSWATGGHLLTSLDSSTHRSKFRHLAYLAGYRCQIPVVAPWELFGEVLIMPLAWDVHTEPRRAEI